MTSELQHQLEAPSTGDTTRGEPGPVPGAGCRSPYWRAVGLAVVCGAVYLVFAGGLTGRLPQTTYAHHILMADAFLHGQLHVRREALRAKAERIAADVVAELDAYLRATGRRLSPEEAGAVVEARTAERLLSDWAIRDDRVYGYWAPLTPAVMMPFVAVWGPEVSDRLINVLFGTVNVCLFYLLLRRVNDAGWLGTTEACRVALTVLFALGTAHFWLTCRAQVWFAVQVVTLTACLGGLLAACTPRPGTGSWLLSGVLFGAAILGRNIVGVTVPFYLGLMWLQGRARVSARRSEPVSWAVAFVVPVMLAVAVQAWYNQARFGSPWDSGLALQVQTGGLSRFREAYEEHGVFSLHHVPHNLYYYFLNARLPRLGDGRIWFDSEGNSLFLVTPPMAYLFFSLCRRSGFTVALWAGVVPLLAVLMLYFATGFVQFGPRYLLDGLPLLLLLVATGMRGRLSRPGYVLIVLAVGAHLFGTYRMCDEACAPLRPYVSLLTLPALVLTALVVGLAVSRRSTADARTSPGAAPGRSADGR